MNNEDTTKPSAVQALLDRINNMQYIISALENRICGLERDVRDLRNNISTVGYTGSYTDLQNIPVISCRHEQIPVTNTIPNYITTCSATLTITNSNGTEMHFDASQI